MKLKVPICFIHIRHNDVMICSCLTVIGCFHSSGLVYNQCSYKEHYWWWYLLETLSCAEQWEQITGGRHRQEKYSSLKSLCWKKILLLPVLLSAQHNTWRSKQTPTADQKQHFKQVNNNFEHSCKHFNSYCYKWACKLLLPLENQNSITRHMFWAEHIKSIKGLSVCYWVKPRRVV